MLILVQDRDVFVDLGSGVGQLVIHMTGGSKVRKAVGIEIASLPNRYAQNLSIEFKKYVIEKNCNFSDVSFLYTMKMFIICTMISSCYSFQVDEVVWQKI